MVEISSLFAPCRFFPVIVNLFMVGDKNPAVVKDYDLVEYSFDAVLDTTCERLRESQIQDSIRRIREMEEELKGLERELDEIMGRMSAKFADTD